MNQEIATIIAALTGAVVGSIGAGYVRQLSEKRRRRDRVRQSYLLQLQDALESLKLRFHNLAHREGRPAMQTKYYEATTVYAWARVVAYSRILLLDGIYAQVGGKLSAVLRTGFEQIDCALKDDKFQHYDRLALAESLIVREGNRLRPSTYLEFRRQREDPLSEWPFKDAAVMVNSFDTLTLDKVCDQVSKMLHHIKKETKIALSERAR